MSLKDFLSPIQTDQFDGGVVIDGHLIAPFWFDGEFDIAPWGEVIGIRQVTLHGKITIDRNKPLYDALRVAFERDYFNCIRDALDDARERARDDHADMLRGEVRL